LAIEEPDKTARRLPRRERASATNTCGGASHGCGSPCAAQVAHRRRERVSPAISPEINEALSSTSTYWAEAAPRFTRATTLRRGRILHLGRRTAFDKRFVWWVGITDVAAMRRGRSFRRPPRLRLLLVNLEGQELTLS
jgi:hypothetical protein